MTSVQVDDTSETKRKLQLKVLQRTTACGWVQVVIFTTDLCQQLQTQQHGSAAPFISATTSAKPHSSSRSVSPVSHELKPHATPHMALPLLQQCADFADGVRRRIFAHYVLGRLGFLGLLFFLCHPGTQATFQSKEFLTKRWQHRELAIAALETRHNVSITARYCS